MKCQFLMQHSRTVVFGLEKHLLLFIRKDLNIDYLLTQLIIYDLLNRYLPYHREHKEFYHREHVRVGV